MKKNCSDQNVGIENAQLKKQLILSYEQDAVGNKRSTVGKSYQTLIPIAHVNSSEYIHGFENIIIEFIDAGTLKIVKKILPLLKDGIAILFNGHQNYDSPIGPFSNLMAMLAPKTTTLRIDDKFDLIKFHQYDPNFIYGLQSINVVNYTRSLEALFVEWLHFLPLEDGKPKMLAIGLEILCDCSMDLIQRIKKEFFKSTERTNFIIKFYFYGREVQSDDDEEEEKVFKYENKVTGEIFEFYCNLNEYILIRHKKDGAKTPRVEWEEQIDQMDSTKIWIH